MYPVVGRQGEEKANVYYQIMSSNWDGLWDGNIDKSFRDIGIGRPGTTSGIWCIEAGAGKAGETNKTDSNWIGRYPGISCNDSMEFSYQGHHVYCVAFPNF